MSALPQLLAETSGVVQVDRDQFAIATPAADLISALASGSLLEVGPGYLTTFTGISNGPARVTVRLFDAEPPESDGAWEVVEASTVVADGPLRVQSIDGVVASGISEVPRGFYCVRAYARGRDRATSLEVVEPVEDYQFDLWPCVSNDEGSYVFTIRKDDHAWSTDQAATNAPTTPDYTRVYIKDTNGNPAKVSPDSVEAEEAKVQLAAAGGLSFEGWSTLDALEARKVAHLDAGIVLWLSEQSDEILDEFKISCIRQAILESGLDRHSWVSEVVDDVIGNHRTGDYYETVRAVENDPEIEKKIVPGLPVSFEVVQQTEAIKTLAGFLDPSVLPYQVNESSALHRALETYGYTLATFGMGRYTSLISILRDTFDIPT